MADCGRGYLSLPESPSVEAPVPRQGGHVAIGTWWADSQSPTQWRGERSLS